MGSEFVAGRPVVCSRATARIRTRSSNTVRFTSRRHRGLQAVTRLRSKVIGSRSVALPIALLLGVLFSWQASLAQAQSTVHPLPTISATNADGEKVALGDGVLTDFELELRAAVRPP